jgi:hypothetical protein
VGNEAPRDQQIDHDRHRELLPRRGHVRVAVREGEELGPPMTVNTVQ